VKVRRVLPRDQVAVQRYVLPPLLGGGYAADSALADGDPDIAETGELVEAADPPTVGPQQLVDIAEVERARAEGAEEGYRNGYAAGFQAGSDEGQEKGFQEGAQQAEAQLTAALEERFGSLLEALKEAAQNVTGEANRLNDQVETLVPRAVMLVGEAVARHALATNEDAIVQIVRDCLGRLERAAQVNVRVNPADYERLAEQPAEAWSSPHLTFTPDDSVTSGGAVVTTDAEIVDARFETRLLEAARAVLFPQETG